MKKLESWRRIESHPNYLVSNLGRIRNNETGTIRVLNPTGRGGHRQVTLRRKGRVYGLLIHRLVLEAFIGKCPKNMECRHLDGNPANNHLSNICWGTRKENREDMVRHGTNLKQLYGELAGASKLTQLQVNEIRSLYVKSDKRFGTKALGEKYGVHQSNISYIINNKTWNRRETQCSRDL